MRGDDPKQGANWSYISPEARVPKEHPLRAIRTMVERALAELDPVFRRMYSPIGRPSIPPELLLRALVLQLTPKDAPTGKDGTPGGAGDFKGQRRSNETHQSTTDPDARLYRKGSGQEAKLCYLGHVLLENRHGLAVGGILTQAGGTAEREAALALITQVPRAAHVTLGCDKAYDSADFVAHARAAGVTPVSRIRSYARRSCRRSSRTTRSPVYLPIGQTGASRGCSTDES